MLLSSPSQPLSPVDVHKWQAIIVEMGVSYALYGIQAALFLAVIPVLARKKGNAWILLAAVIVLYLCSTIGVASRLVSYSIQAPLLGFHPPAIIDFAILYRQVYILFVVATRVNYVLSDALVVWRAWVIWPHSRVARGMLAFCIGCSLIGTVVEGVFLVRLLYAKHKAPTLILAMDLPLLVTNATATVLVGIKVWIYRRDVSASLGPYSAGSRVGGVLLLLMESGMVYCSIWFVHAGISTAKSLSMFSPYRIISSVIYLLSGIYPTMVVVIVTAQQHATAEFRMKGQSSFLESLHFAPWRNLPQREVGSRSEETASSEVMEMGSSHGERTVS
ncbi:hypothetical protein BD626DRAFT_502624 [Schizophyllum amplum]|uniref:Fungal pheromone mating factor STE2 GPCR-domain-containing protein n=1 Tax=Schizophyllum amplum TaxID=97359 RepID=A0A550C8R3_9AGAR|nr:hypothetical protein BD626DRAFT_502624 [Auriculariopsis ampla]